MKKSKTCFGCKHLRHSELAGIVPLAYCGATDDSLVVPHTADSKTITYTRVPEFCAADDRFKSDRPAPVRDWDTCESLPIIQRECD